MDYLDRMSSGGIVAIREELMKAQALGKKVYRFESGDPSFNPHPKIKEAIKEALDQNKTHYIAVDGIPELKRAIAKSHTEKGTTVEPDDVFITTGAMNGLYLLYEALNDGSIKNIAVPDPMWTEAVENIKLAGIGTHSVEFDPSFENYTWDKISSFLNKDLSGVFINSPHNPTGKVLSLDQKKEIVDESVKNNLWIISDEAYESITYGAKHTLSSSLIPKEYDKWVSIHSMSKSFAMPGLRIGWLITKNKKLKSRLSKLVRCNINGVNSITQWGALAALSLDNQDEYFKDMHSEYSKRRDIIYNAVNGSKLLDPIYPEGGFFLWCKVKEGFDAKIISEKLAHLGMGNAPGSCFGQSKTTLQSIRFSFSVDTDQVIAGSQELRNLLDILP